MKTWMMVKSNIRKNRSSSITLVLLIVFAAIFLDIGINTVISISRFYDDKNESLQGADFITFGHLSNREDAINVIRNLDGYQFLEDENVLFYTGTAFMNPSIEEKPQSIDVMLLDMDVPRQTSQLKLIEAQDELKEDSIIVPYSLKTGFGYQSGDQIEITYEGEKNTYHIYAFAEDIMFPNAISISCYKCFVPSKVFHEVYEKATDQTKYTYIRVRLEDGVDSQDFDNEFNNKAGEVTTSDLTSMVGLNYSIMKSSGSITISILMMILVVFAVLIIVIAMVIIRFTIVSHIEQDLKNIGSMEAAGFTGNMICRALLAQYLLIMLAGYLIGNVVAYLSSGTVSKIIAATLGLNWNQRITVRTMVITLFLLTFLILIVTLHESRRIQKVTPLMAVRNGIATFHFGKNHLPLDQTRGNLHVVLGMKQLIHNKKQNFWIGLIGFLMSASMVFSLAMYNNFVTRQNVMLNLIGQENANVTVEYEEKEYQEFFDQLGACEGVRKTSRVEVKNGSVSYKDQLVTSVLQICDDYKKNEIHILTEGRMPEHENEIALSYAVNDSLGADIGDVVQLIVGGNPYEFVVVGFTQHIGYLGKSISITESGMLRCNPEFIPDTLLIYLDKQYKTKEFIDRISENCKQHQAVITNVDDSLVTMLSTLNKGITLICVIIVVITLGIVVLILYYLVKEKLIKDQLQIGIHKALGFTTRQLILSMNFEFLPVIFLSSAGGGILTILLINPICNLILSFASIKKCSMATNPRMLVISVAVLSLAALAVTTCVSLRIRKIQPKDLFFE